MNIGVEVLERMLNFHDKVEDLYREPRFMIPTMKEIMNNPGLINQLDYKLDELYYRIKETVEYEAELEKEKKKIEDMIEEASDKAYEEGKKEGEEESEYEHEEEKEQLEQQIYDLEYKIRKLEAEMEELKNAS